MSDTPELTPEDVKEILRLVDEAQLDEFELETPRLSIRFRRGEAPPRDTGDRPGTPGSDPDLRFRREEAPPPPVPVPAASAASAEPARGLADVTAPMVGTFYRAPGPGEPPFVEVGSTVEEGTQVCILEVMKLMSPVAAGTAGVVAEICRANGEVVGYGDLLFRVRPA